MRTCSRSTPSLAALEAACVAFGAAVNALPHRVTRRPPAELPAVERARLHPLPPTPFSGALGTTRRVGADTPMVTFEGGSYLVPPSLAGQSVWVAGTASRLWWCVPARTGRSEVARHAVTTPGRPRVEDGHFPPAPPGALDRRPRARTLEEVAFLALGDGAALWLTEAAAAGTRRIRAKMADAVALAKLGDPVAVNWALAHAAVTSRFAEADLAAILTHRASAAPGPTCAAGEAGSLAQETAAWTGLGGTGTR